MSATPHSNVTQGLLLAASAYLIFTIQDVLVRLLVKADIPIWQVLSARSLIILFGCLFMAGPRVVVDSIRAPSKWSLILRGIFILGAWLCYYTASKTLPYGQLVTIYYAAPIIITVLSIFMLKETVGIGRWSALALGFVGVSIACEPGSLGFALPVWLTLGAAILWSLSNILLRKAGLTENVLMQMFMSNGIFVIGCCVPTILYWHAMTAFQWLLIIGVGSLGGVAQYLLFKSFRMAPASAIAPMEYSSLVWAFGLGYLIWGEVPNHGVFLGAVLIAASGVGNLYIERWRRKAELRAAASALK